VALSWSDVLNVEGSAPTPAPDASGPAGTSTSATPASSTPSSTAVDRIADAIATAGEKSGSRYDLVGPTDKRGDRPYGRYQVMGVNIPDWSEAAGKGRLTPAQFLSDPATQDAVVKHRIGMLLDQHGNARDVASVWHSGVPYDQAAREGRQDSLGTKTTDYATRVATAAGSGEQGAQPEAAPQKALGWGDVLDLSQPAAAAPTSKEPSPEDKPLPGAGGWLEPYRALHEAGIPLHRESSVEDTGAAINAQFGLDSDHKLGRYLAAGGKPFLDAASDILTLLNSDKPAPSGSFVTDATDTLKRLMAAMHPVTAGPEAFGNTLVELAADAKLPPTAGALLGVLGSLWAGAQLPVGEGLGATPTAAEESAAAMPLRGSVATRTAAAETRAAAEAAEARAASVRASGEAAATQAEQQAATVKEQGEQAISQAQQEAAVVKERGQQWTEAQRAVSAQDTAAAEREAAQAQQEAAGVKERGQQWTEAQRAASAQATAAAEREAAQAQERAAAAERAASPSPENAARARAALTPAGVTEKQGGQAATAALEGTLEEWKDPVQGIYDSFVRNHDTEVIVDPSARQEIVKGITALEDTLGPTFSGTPADILTDLRDRLAAGEPVTVGDVNKYKSQLDILLPGRAKIGANLKEASLYDLKFKARDLMRSAATGDEKEWLGVADEFWRSEVVGRDNPTALGNLVRLAKKTDPAVVIERLFGNGTSAKAGSIADALMTKLKGSGAEEPIRQAFRARLIGRATRNSDGALDPRRLLDSYERLDPTFVKAMTNEGERTFFKVLRQEQTAAEATAAAAKTAADKARTIAAERRAATTQAKQTATQIAAETTAAAAKTAGKARTIAAEGRAATTQAKQTATQIAAEAAAKARETASTARQATAEAARAATGARAEATKATTAAEKDAAQAKKAADVAAAADQAPTRLARVMARGIQIVTLGATGKLVGLAHTAAGAAAEGVAGSMFLPPDRLAQILANSKTANLLARAMKTPTNSAVVPVLLQEMRKAGIIGEPTTKEAA
jgi:DNA polymerase III gamma/tau subunit